MLFNTLVTYYITDKSMSYGEETPSYTEAGTFWGHLIVKTSNERLSGERKQVEETLALVYEAFGAVTLRYRDIIKVGSTYYRLSGEPIRITGMTRDYYKAVLVVDLNADKFIEE